MTTEYAEKAGKLEGILSNIDAEAASALRHSTKPESLRDTLAEIRRLCRRGLAGGVLERFCMPEPGECVCPVCGYLSDREGIPCAHCDELDQADREAHEQAHGPVRLG